MIGPALDVVLREGGGGYGSTCQVVSVRRPQPLLRAIGLMAALSVSVMLGLVNPASVAGATTFHEYSRGVISAATNFTGLEQTRYDHTMKISSGSTCTVHFYHGDPVYQDQWVQIAGITDTWVELGTGHQCSTNEFWFGAYGYKGSFNLLWTLGIFGGTDHSFFLYAVTVSGGQHWRWTIGSTQHYTWANGWKGNKEYAGMESWSPTVSTVYHSFALNYQKNDTQTWHGWTSPSKTGGRTPMCYAKTSTTVLYFGEHTTC